MKFKEAVTYVDMLMVPQYSDIQSRNEVDISSDLGRGKVLELPVIASPMDTVSEDAMAIAMNNAGGMAILHRYNTVEEQQAMAQRVVDQTDWNGNVAAANVENASDDRRAVETRPPILPEQQRVAIGEHLDALPHRHAVLRVLSANALDTAA